MKQTINLYDFRDAFASCNRGEQFTYAALEVLFDYFESFEDDTGEEIELDVIAICCEYSEETWNEIADNYSIDTSDCKTDDDGKQAVEEYLLDNTSLCGMTDNTLVYAQF